MYKKMYLPFLLIGSILVMIHIPTQCQSMDHINRIVKYERLIDHSLFLVVVNPSTKKQLNLEKKVSKRQERKALKKYVKKDFKKNRKGGDKNYLASQKKTDAVAIIMLIRFGLLIVGLIVLASVFSEGFI